MQCFPEVHMLNCQSGIHTFQQKKKGFAPILNKWLQFKPQTRNKKQKEGRSKVVSLFHLGSQAAVKCLIGFTKAHKW